MKSYKGKRLPSDEVEIVVHDTATNRESEYPLRHIVVHSPTGMSWGYGGSGPADLAVSILVDFLGGTGPKIPRDCRGLNPDGTRCAHNYCLALTMHQAFKWAFVAKWPRERWEIDEVEIGRWAAGVGERSASRVS
jgi:hypothetical protein